MKKLAVFIGIAAMGLLPVASAHAATDYVRICTTQSPGYYIEPGSQTCIAADAGVKAEEGVAIDLALPGTVVDPGKSFGVSAHFGTFEGQNAIGVGAAFRVNDGVTFDGGVGVGLGQHTVAGRAGLSFAW